MHNYYDIYIYGLQADGEMVTLNASDVILFIASIFIKLRDENKKHYYDKNKKHYYDEDK